MENKTKVCSVCHKSKPLDQYYKVKKTGLYTYRCKPCNKAYAREWSRNHKNEEKTGTPVGELDFLLHTRKVAANGWTVPQINFLLKKVKENLGKIPLQKIFVKYGSSHSILSNKTLLLELRKLARYNIEQRNAGKKEESVEDYWNSGRRFKYMTSNKVLVKAKK